VLHVGWSCAVSDGFRRLAGYDWVGDAWFVNSLTLGIFVFVYLSVFHVCMYVSLFFYNFFVFISFTLCMLSLLVVNKGC